MTDGNRYFSYGYRLFHQGQHAISNADQQLRLQTFRATRHIVNYKVKVTNKKYKVYHCNLRNKTGRNAEILPSDFLCPCKKPHDTGIIQISQKLYYFHDVSSKITYSRTGLFLCFTLIYRDIYQPGQWYCGFFSFIWVLFAFFCIRRIWEKEHLAGRLHPEKGH